MSALILFADGASSGNPGPGGWGTILVYPFRSTGSSDPSSLESLQVQELGGGQAGTTNNRMELTSIIEGLGAVIAGDIPGEPVRIYTDSTYVIRGITQWIHGWKRNGWKTAGGGEVLNRDLWSELDARVARLRGMGRKLEWNYVPGHSGIPGNERTDEIAVLFSKTRAATLYRGPLSGYEVRILEIPESGALPQRSGSGSGPGAPGGGGGAKKSAAYYLSYVDGLVQKHATWAECEARVKGKSGARYKKVQSPAEEKETLRGWGVGAG